jgi:hypothetical protein
MFKRNRFLSGARPVGGSFRVLDPIVDAMLRYDTGF